MALEGKKILICITGGIAAYKVNFLVRLLVRQNAEVQVLLTPDAKEFVSPLTLSTLSGRPVYSEFSGVHGTWTNHVELALWADLLLVAPCTAHTLAKMMHGICDNLVLATYLSAKSPVFIAPAMDLDMYAHFTTRQNLEIAEDQGHHIIPAEAGELASGLHGEGRMAEPETILNTLRTFFDTNKSDELKGKTVLITAGPTYEAIDPVRFIGNHSSGKMGFALAEEAARRGATVELVTGPVNLSAQNGSINVHRITTAREMFTKVFEFYDKCDVAIASAAVADYAPAEIAREKIKKNDADFTLRLVKNPDILLEMGERKQQQILVGFALETDNGEENARQKLQKKNLDFIVLNSPREQGAGFGTDTNKISLISRDEITNFELKPKQAVAADILDEVQKRLMK